MTSGSVDDDRDDGITVGTSDAERAAPVVSDDFVDSILGMAERRAELVETDPAGEGNAVSRQPIAPIAPIASLAFVDDVLAEAQTRADAAIEVRAQAKTAKGVAPTAVAGSRANAAERVARSTNATGRTPEVGSETPQAEAPSVDKDLPTAHVHPTRPTPWWRKRPSIGRPSLEIVFAVIATVLMVVGLALVVAELF